MIFFMKKPKDEEEIEEIKKAVEGKIISKPTLRKDPEMFEPRERYEPEIVERPQMPTTSGSVPLFVKIEKYKNILNVLNEMKTTILMLKNALALQRELQRAYSENETLIQNAVSKMDKKLLSLDAEFLRPRGFKEDLPEHVYEEESLDYAVDNLKSQIDDLKSELEET